jgi:hypothetical protein
VEVAVPVNTVDWAIVVVTESVQPLTSFIMNVNVPAVLEKVPVPVYGAVPPVALIVTIELPPLHAIFVWICEATSGVGCVTVALVEAVQLLASVTVRL